MLETFWKTKKRYRIILKSGTSFIIKADELTVKYNTATNDVIGYEFTGLEGSFPLHIVPSEIAAVIRL